ncbi:MAG TPA: hypothetical protein VF610_11090 [Segetibacter sp.]|jgi:translation elongation factor EF-1beta
MKFLFIAGCLEKGRDGVGDYTRCLAGELVKHGHEVSILAINDLFIAEVVTESVPIGNSKISLFRIPSNFSAQKWFEKAEAFVQQQNPDIISLQFVPFSFHKKGLPFGLSKRLAKLGKGKDWQIMFHELWVGMDAEASIKSRWWGEVQRLLIRDLIQRLRPKVIHTQTNLYKVQLEKMGFAVKTLSLFSNIPREKSTNEAVANVQKKLEGVDITELALFASIHPGAPVEDFAKEVAEITKSENRIIHLLLIGRSGPEQTRWAETWKRFGLSLTILEEQSAEMISRKLSEASVGVSTTPLAQIEKSGAVAAMREHNLPILCVSRSWSPKGIEGLAVASDVFEYKKGNLATILKPNFKFSSSYKPVAEIAKQFIEDISRAVIA